MSDSEKITENVFLVGSEELSGSGDCMIYAIGLKNGEMCLIDAGTANAAQILANIGQTKVLNANKITHLILTHAHYDHIGAAHQFKQDFPQLKIYAHSWDVAAIEGLKGTEQMTAASWYGAHYTPVKVDVVFKKDMEMITLGGTSLWIYHIPGHTPGSIAVFINKEKEKVLFGQDIHGPFMEEFKSNVQDWAKSMKKLVALEADILCEGHFGIFRGKDSVKNFIQGQLRQNRML
jgi:glyoxylase-like metal-dependent hydrolase (beta-lactamase superfamily II)